MARRATRKNLSDGSAEITFDVGDIDEVVRWAMGYGDEAVVLSPPEAVLSAIKTLHQLQLAYGNVTPVTSRKPIINSAKSPKSTKAFNRVN